MHLQIALIELQRLPLPNLEMSARSIISKPGPTGAPPRIPADLDVTTQLPDAVCHPDNCPHDGRDVSDRATPRPMVQPVFDAMPALLRIRKNLNHCRFRPVVQHELQDEEYRLCQGTGFRLGRRVDLGVRPALDTEALPALEPEGHRRTGSVGVVHARPRIPDDDAVAAGSADGVPVRDGLVGAVAEDYDLGHAVDPESGGAGSHRRLLGFVGGLEDAGTGERAPLVHPQTNLVVRPRRWGARGSGAGLLGAGLGAGVGVGGGVGVGVRRRGRRHLILVVGVAGEVDDGGARSGRRGSFFILLVRVASEVYDLADDDEDFGGCLGGRSTSLGLSRTRRRSLSGHRNRHRRGLTEQERHSISSRSREVLLLLVINSGPLVLLPAGFGRWAAGGPATLQLVRGHFLQKYVSISAMRQ